MSNLVSLKEYTRCPRTRGCTGKKIYKDLTSNDLFSITAEGLTPHKCNSETLEMPTVFYMGEWYNTRTGSTRYIGPTRMEKSVLKAPVDKGTDNEWELTALYESPPIEWKKIDPSPTYLTKE